jgi:hypothetical protein
MRAFSYGQVKPVKTKGSRRRVTLPARAAAALELVPRRLDTRLVFPGSRGAHIDLRNWRKREWKPALEAAGRPRERRPYDLRHSFAAWGARRRDPRLRRRPIHGHERADAGSHVRPPRGRTRRPSQCRGSTCTRQRLSSAAAPRHRLFQIERAPCFAGSSSEAGSAPAECSSSAASRSSWRPGASACSRSSCTCEAG